MQTPLHSYGNTDYKEVTANTFFLYTCVPALWKDFKPYIAYHSCTTLTFPHRLCMWLERHLFIPIHQHTETMPDCMSLDYLELQRKVISLLQCFLHKSKS